MVFKPGIDPVPVSGKVVDEDDRAMLMKAVNEMWLTAGHFVDEFEQALAQYFNVSDAIMVNSGSSANLLALAALELPKGSEVITTALAFPTTINPIIQFGLIPVLVDIDANTLNVNYEELLESYSNKVGAVILTHTLGRPFNLYAVKYFCDKYDIPLIEDCCDAAGATYNEKKVGSFGKMATLSFYPAHQITTGEGGAVLTNDPKLARVIRSYRDWGRDCWCKPGIDNTCGRRFDGEYDHKYTYSKIGYHLASTDLQAAIGLSQLKKLDKFVEIRRKNHDYLHERLSNGRFGLIEPDSGASWFGFAINVGDRNDLARYLDKYKIGNRPVFAGNILKQPAYKNIPYRKIGHLSRTNYVHDHVLWVGCWPGLTKEQLDYTIEVLHGFDY